MSTVINVKVNPKVKSKAQRVAAELGLTLSGVINAYLHELIRTESLFISLRPEVPSKKLIRAMKEAENDSKKGRLKTFTTKEAALHHLKNI